MLVFELNVAFQHPMSHEVSRVGSLRMSCDSLQHARNSAAKSRSVAAENTMYESCVAAVKTLLPAGQAGTGSGFVVAMVSNCKSFAPVAHGHWGRRCKAIPQMSLSVV